MSEMSDKPDEQQADVESDSSALTDAEIAELHQDVMREFDERPPIQCLITYNWRGNQQLADKVLGLIQIHAIFMRRRHPWMTFDSLDSMVFHHDYAQALAEVSERVGRQCKATSEPGGVGLAMVVHLKEKCIAVFDESIALGIAGEDEDHQAFCLDMVMHELCHVHDHGRKGTLLKHEFLQRKLKGLELHFFTAADAAWNEYFANKYSHSNKSSPDLHPKQLAEVVEEVSTSILEAIRAYRAHGRIDELLGFVEKKVNFLFQCIGYAAGRLHGMESSLKIVAPETHEALERAGLLEMWDAALDELQRLDGCKDNWSSFDEFQPLMNVVEMVMRHLGLHYRDTPQGICVDVPFTSETMPESPTLASFSSLLDAFRIGPEDGIKK